MNIHDAVRTVRANRRNRERLESYQLDERELSTTLPLVTFGRPSAMLVADARMRPR